MRSCVPENDAIHERIAHDEIDAVCPLIVTEFEARTLPSRQLGKPDKIVCSRDELQQLVLVRDEISRCAWLNSQIVAGRLRAECHGPHKLGHIASHRPWSETLPVIPEVLLDELRRLLAMLDIDQRNRLSRG